MKFRFGAMPKDASFEPEREGWIRVREPGLVKVQLIALPAMVAVGLLFHFLYWLAGADISPLTNIRNAPIGLAIMVGIAPVHELLHLLCCPRFGRGDQAIVGFWPKMFCPYVYYNGVLSRNRYIFICVCPFIVLSIVPLAVGFIRPDIPVFIVAVSYLNCLMCGMDLASIFLLLKLVPRRAEVRNNGFDTHWRRSGSQEPT